MNYQEMSDFEISRAVGDLLGVEWANLDENYNPLCIWPNDNFRKGDDGLFVFDPCSSWADAGPIIQEHGINLMASKVVDSGGLKEWEAMSYEGNCHYWGELNPLRAAMIVFLMMKGGE